MQIRPLYQILFIECRIKLACLIFLVPSTVQIYHFTTCLLFIIQTTILGSHPFLAIRTAPCSTEAGTRIHGGPAGTQITLQAHTPAGRAEIPQYLWFWTELTWETNTLPVTTPISVRQQRTADHPERRTIPTWSNFPKSSSSVTSHLPKWS